MNSGTRSIGDAIQMTANTSQSLALRGAESCHSSSNVKATLPQDGLTAEELVASVRAAAAGLQVDTRTRT